MTWWVQLGPWVAVLVAVMGAVWHFDRRLTRVERDVAWIRAALVSNGFTGGSDG